MEDSNKTPIVLGAIAAGLGTAALARKAKITNNLQKAIKDKGLVIGLSYSPSKKRKLLANILYSTDLKFKNIDKNKNEFINAPVFYKNIVENNKTYSRNSINSQTVGDNLFFNLRDKSSLSDLEEMGDLFPKTRKLSDILTEFSIDKNQFKTLSKEEVDKVFSNIESKYGKQFLKPISGQSMGKGTNKIYSTLDKATSKKKVKPEGFEKLLVKEKYIDNPKALDELKSNLDDYILTEYLGNNPETRIHTLNGDVVDTVRRFGFFEGTGNKFFNNIDEKIKFEQKLKNLYKIKGLEKENVSLAFDATRDLNGNIRLIEANPNSGFLFNLTDVTTKTPYIRPWEYASTHKFYKKLTGRDTTAVAGLKGLGVTGGILGGSAAVDYTMEKKAEDSTGKKALTAAGISAVLGSLAYPFIKNKKTLYHVLPSDHYILNRNKLINKLLFGDRKFVTISELKNVKLKDTDSVYFDVPGRLLEDESFIGKNMINNRQDVYKFFDDKSNLKNLKNIKQNIPELSDLSNYNNSLNSSNSLEEFVQSMKNLKGSDYEFIIKPKDGFAGKGIISSLDRDRGSKTIGLKKFFNKQDIINNLNKESYIVNFNKAKKDPDKYIIQNYIETPNEYRVGILNDKIIKTSPRHELSKKISGDELAELNLLAKKLGKDLKDKNMSNNTYLGIDVGFKDNKPIIYDINTNDGFTQVPFERKFYKGVTGETPMNYKIPALTGSATLSGVVSSNIIYNKDRQMEKNAQAATLPLDFLVGADPTGVMSKKRAIATKDYETTRRVLGNLGAFGLGAAVSTLLTAGAFKVSGKFLKKSPALAEIFDTAAKDTLLVFKPKEAKNTLKKLNDAQNNALDTLGTISSLDKDLAVLNNNKALQAEDLKLINDRIKNKDFEALATDETLLEKVKSKENEQMLDTFIKIKNKAKDLKNSRDVFYDKHQDTSMDVLRKGGAIATGLASGILGGILNSASADSQWVAGKEIQKLRSNKNK